MTFIVKYFVAKNNFSLDIFNLINIKIERQTDEKEDKEQRERDF